MFKVVCAEAGKGYEHVCNGYGEAVIFAREAKEHGCIDIKIWELKQVV